MLDVLLVSRARAAREGDSVCRSCSCVKLALETHPGFGNKAAALWQQTRRFKIDVAKATLREVKETNYVSRLDGGVARLLRGPIFADEQSTRVLDRGGWMTSEGVGSLVAGSSSGSGWPGSA